MPEIALSSRLRVLRSALPHRYSRHWLDAVIVCCSLAGCAYAIALVLAARGALPEGAGLSAESALVLVVDLALAAACSLLLPFRGQPARSRLLLLARFVLLEFFLTATIAEANLELALLVPFLLEIAAHEAFWRNCLLVGLVLALFFAIRSANLELADHAGTSAALSARVLAQSRTILPSAGYLLFLLLFGLAACVLVYYRERAELFRSRLKVMSKVVSKLSMTNQSYQDIAKEASAKSQEQERLRITRELHDIIGYTFTSNIMMMEAAVSIMYKNPAKVSHLIDEARSNTQAGLEQIRTSLYLLRNSSDPPASIQQTIIQISRIFGLAKLDFGNFPEVQDAAVADFFHYFIQQAITNSFVHGEARHIELTLYASADSLYATVLDDGKGCADIVEGIGLSGMRERLRELGGTLTITDLPHGFEITSEVPRVRERAGTHG